MTAFDQLAAVLPVAALLTAPSDVAPYATPWRGDAGRAALVVRPGSVEELRDTVRWAVANRVRLVPQGANTGLVGGGVPGRGGESVVLSTDRLTAPPQVRPTDGVVIATAGTLVSTVQAAAAEHGMFLPIDLSADASVGGIVATNAGGSRVLRYGDTRQRTLAVQAVLVDDDASLIGDTRPLRKRNEGPRLTDLLIGAGGQLGIITAAALRLAHVPPYRTTCFLVPRPAVGPAALGQQVQRLGGDAIAAIELLSRSSLQLVADHVPSQQVTFLSEVDDYVLLVELEGDDEHLLSLLDALTDHVHDAFVVDPERAWSLRHSLSEAQQLAGHVVGLDVAVAPSDVDALRRRVRAELERWHPTAVLADFGHLGDGGMHLNVVLDPQDRDLSPAVRHLVYALVDEFGGTFSAEHGLGPTNLDHWLRATSHSDRLAHAALKHAMDPAGVLGNPTVAQALGDPAVTAPPVVTKQTAAIKKGPAT